jgi:hypothetical protein
LFVEEEKQPAHTLTEKAVEENVKNHVPVLYHNTKEWMNQDS